MTSAVIRNPDRAPATLAATLHEPRAVGTTFEVFAGDTPLAAARAGL